MGGGALTTCVVATLHLTQRVFDIPPQRRKHASYEVRGS